MGASLLASWTQLGGGRVQFVQSLVQSEAPALMDRKGIFYINIPSQHLLASVAESFLRAPEGTELFSLWPIDGLAERTGVDCSELEQVPTTWSRLHTLHHFTRTAGLS